MYQSHEHYPIPQEHRPMVKLLVNVLFLATWFPAWLSSTVDFFMGDTVKIIPSGILTIIAIILAALRARMYYHDARAKRIANRIAEEGFYEKHKDKKI